MHLYKALFLLCAASADLYAHPTWLLGSVRHNGVDSELNLALTTGNAFPKLGLGNNPANLLRASVISGDSATVLLTHDAATQALLFKAQTNSDSAVLALVQLKPALVELDAANVATYVHELGGALAISRRYKAQGQWRERYSKSAKIWIRVGTADAPRALLAPMNLPYELVPSSDPSQLRAGDTLGICAYANGVALGKAYIGMIAADGQKTFARADRSGCTHFRLKSASGYLVHSIDIKESTLPALEWESQFASFTVLDSTPKTPASAAISTP